MRLRRLPLAFLVSLLLHVVLALLMWRFAGGGVSPSATAPRPVSIELVELSPAPRPVPVAPPVVVKKAPPRTPKPPPPTARAPASTKPPPSEPSPPLASTPPGGATAPAPDAPLRGPRLMPELPLSAGLPVAQGEPSRGRTLRPGDPELSAEVQRLEGEKRVTERVEGWVHDTLAEARAEAGGHPYFGEVGGALRSALNHAEGGTPAQLGVAGELERMGQRYGEAMSDYAKTGNPGLPPPGQAPTQGEKQRELFGNDAMLLQALTQGAQLAQDLRTGKPLLTLTFELRQRGDGQFRQGNILQGSGNPRFDAFVLRVVPGAMERLGPPPDAVLHGRDELRSVWRIDGWPASSALEAARPSLGASGLPVDGVRGQLQHEALEFDFRARLLRAY